MFRSRAGAMMLKKAFAGAFILSCLLGLRLVFGQATGADLTISGTIKDTTNQPVPDVTVDVWQHGRRFTANSQSDGNYSVTFRSGRPINAVIYSKPGFHPTGI